MRFARKLVLFAVAAAATMALTAPSAQALEIATEATGVHCTAITPTANEPFITHGTGGGGCRFRFHSLGTVEIGDPLGNMTECNITFEGRLNELGEGFIYSQTFTGCTVFTVTPCNVDGVAPSENWILHVNGEHGANGAEIRICWVMIGSTFNCHLLLDLSENPLHRYRLSTGGVHRSCEDGRVTIRGTWEQEGVTQGTHPAIEIRG
jgi:hypothetical protein